MGIEVEHHEPTVPWRECTEETGRLQDIGLGAAAIVRWQTGFGGRMER